MSFFVCGLVSGGGNGWSRGGDEKRGEHKGDEEREKGDVFFGGQGRKKRGMKNSGLMPSWWHLGLV